jgi:hypothetical protein
MSQEAPISNLSEQLNRVRKAFLELIKPPIDKTVGTTSAKGLSKVTDTIWKSILRYFSKFPEIFFGKTSSKKGQKSNNWLDNGICFITAFLASLDLCSIINTISNLTDQLDVAKFNPNQNPPPNDFKWKIQKIAYEIQVGIDAFNRVYSAAANPGDSITTLIASIAPQLQKLTSEEYLGSPEMRKAFPQVDQMNNFLGDTLRKMQERSEISNTDKTEIQNYLKKINLIRQTCVLIQGLTTPANLVKFAESALPPGVYESIDKFGVNNINPDKLSEILGGTRITINKINKISSSILKFIGEIQAGIKIAIILAKVFRVIIGFFIVMPLPNLVTTSGITTGFAKAERNIDDYLKKTIKFLSEVNTLVAIIVSMLKGLSLVLDQIESDLSTIIDKLKACSRGNDPINVPVDQDTIIGLERELNTLRNNNNAFKEFVINYETKNETNKKTYEGYTIEIRTEDVSDQNVLKVTLPRRYGIALDGAGIQAVRSDFTYASDDSVIINQVKLLLVSKGLAKPQRQEQFTNDQLDVLNQAMAAIPENDLSVEDITPQSPTSEYLDSPDGEDENDGLGLNAFVNKLSGGKRLRKRIKESMAKSKENLATSLKSAKK